MKKLLVLFPALLLSGCEFLNSFFDACAYADYAFNNQQYAKAVEQYSECLASGRRPEYSVLFYRGLSYKSMQNYNEALLDLTDSIKHNDAYSWSYLNRGSVYNELQQFDAAITDFSRAIELEPRDYSYLQRAYLYGKRGQYDLAEADFKQVISLNAYNTDGYNDYAWMLVTASDPAFRNGNKALELAERAVSMTSRQHAAYLDTLAAAHAEVGEFTMAASIQREAVDLYLSQGDPESAAQIKPAIAAYEAQQHYYLDHPDQVWE